MIAAEGQIVWLRDLVTVVVEGDRATRIHGVMWLTSHNAKQAEEALRVQASLLDLTHDTVFTRHERCDHLLESRRRDGTKRRRPSGRSLTSSCRRSSPRRSRRSTRNSSGRDAGKESTHPSATGRRSWQLADGRCSGTSRSGPLRSWRPTTISAQSGPRRQLSKAQTELAYITRVMTMGELAASIAHEINPTPGRGGHQW